MKPVVLLGIVCAALAGALYLRHTRANRDLEAARAGEQRLSNEVAQLQTRLVLAQGEAIREGTNHQAMLHRRTSELLNASNLVGQVRAQLTSAQAEAARARDQIQAQAGRISELEGQRDESVRKLEALQSLPGHLQTTREQLAATAAERDALLAESRRLQLELADLHLQLGNPDFLRWQSARVQADLDAARRMATAKPGARLNLNRPLIMENDGTVRLAPPSSPPRPQEP